MIACRSVGRCLTGVRSVSSAAACLLIAVDVSAGTRWWGCWGTGAAECSAPCAWWVQPCTRGAEQQAASAVSGGRAWYGRVFSCRKLHGPVCFALVEASGCSWWMYRVAVSCSSRAVCWLYCMLLCLPPFDRALVWCVVTRGCWSCSLWQCYSHADQTTAHYPVWHRGS